MLYFEKPLKVKAVDKVLPCNSAGLHSIITVSSPMLTRRASSFWALLAFFLAIAIPVLFLAAASPGHTHPNQGAHVCTLCQFSDQPFEAAHDLPRVWPPTSRAQQLDPLEFRLTPKPSLFGRKGRAPPTIVLPPV